MRKIINALSAMLLLAFLSGCAVKEQTQKPLKKDAAKIEKKQIQILQKSLKAPSGIVNSDFDYDFWKALDASVGYYDKLSKTKAVFDFGDVNYTAKEMAGSLRLFKELASLPKDEFLKALDENFDIYESKNEKGSALITGYYAPILKGSFEKTDKFKAPLYPLPSDIVTANLKQFPTANSVRDIAGRIKDGKLIPYYTREEIKNGALKVKPLMYVEKETDAFLLEVQGSGIIDVNGTKHYVGYAGKNGQPYTSIGKVVSDEKLMQSSKINMRTVQELLDSNDSLREYVLNKNKSFVFFKINKQEGIFGNIGVALTAKQSIAMDSALLPRGALSFVKTVIPKKMGNLTSVPKSERVPFEKFFMIQDTGGAIRGGGRVDIYFGEGEDALFYASQTAQSGEVYLLAPKKKRE